MKRNISSECHRFRPGTRFRSELYTIRRHAIRGLRSCAGNRTIFLEYLYDKRYIIFNDKRSETHREQRNNGHILKLSTFGHHLQNVNRSKLQITRK